MSTRLTSKGQATIPKQIRDVLNLLPACAVDFAVNGEGDSRRTAQSQTRPI